MRHLLIFTTLFLTLTGCESMLPKRQGAAVPDWVTAPPCDRRAWLCGVGQGPDLDSAKRAALKDIASGLRVSISSELEKMETVNNGRVDRQSRTRVSEVVQKTEFSQYQVDRTDRTGDGYYVLAKVDRTAFIRERRDKLATLDSSIEAASGNLAGKSALERHVTLHRLQPTLEQALGDAQLLMGADPGGAAGAQVNKYLALQQQARESVSALVVQVQAGPEDRDLADALVTWLNAAGIRTAAAGSHGNILAITSSSRNDTLFGSKVTKLHISLALRDDLGRSVASRDYDISAASRFDYHGARRNAVENWLETLRQTGFAAGLGFHQ